MQDVITALNCCPALGRSVVVGQVMQEPVSILICHHHHGSRVGQLVDGPEVNEILHYVLAWASNIAGLAATGS